MSNKRFSERLNKELDNIGVPPSQPERIDIFHKLMKIPKFQAEAILNGLTTPNGDLLAHLATELEVNGAWLIGQSEHRSKKSDAE